jgi:hypothetical protein
MLKKVVFTTALLVAGLAMVAAQDAGSKSAAPKVGVELIQRLDAEFVNDRPQQATTFGQDAVYSRTEVRGHATFDLGSDSSLVLGVKDRFEIRPNPSATNALGSERFRNRLYLHGDMSIAIDKAFNLGLGVEYRLASDLRSGRDGTTGANPIAPEYRVAPNLKITGKIDDLSYSIGNMFNMYLDFTGGNNVDDFYFEYEGVHSLGYKIKLEGATLGFTVSDDITVTMPKSAAATAGDLPVIWNSLAFKVDLAMGDFNPVVGFFMNSNVNRAGVLVDDVVGASAGVSFKKGSWTLAFIADYGYNMLKEQTESRVSAAVRIR